MSYVGEIALAVAWVYTVFQVSRLYKDALNIKKTEMAERAIELSSRMESVEKTTAEVVERMNTVDQRTNETNLKMITTLTKLGGGR